MQTKLTQISRGRSTRRSNRSRLPAGRPLQFESLEGRQMMAAGDPVIFWNDVALDAVAADHSIPSPDQGGPTRTARALAIVQAAVYDAVNAIDGTHQPYLYRGTAAKSTDVGAAVATAAYGTLYSLYPKQRAVLSTAWKQYLAAIPNGKAENQGIALGTAVAARVLAARINDGSKINGSHSPSVEPGRHRVDPLHTGQGYLTPGWGKVKPFAMQSGTQFRAPPPPALNSQEYADAFNEVMTFGALDAETADRDGNGQPDRTAEQTLIGTFWGYDGSRNLGTPPRLYNQIAQAIAEQEDNTVTENARMFALINLAMADAGIASWETKYHYDFWRPVVAIRNENSAPGPGGFDGNPQTTGENNWAPLGAPATNSNNPSGDFTPPFPAYTSGHATFGAALFESLTNFYGTDQIAFDFVSDEFNGVNRASNGVVRPLVTRHFDDLREAEWENAISRIYLGIHWRFDAEDGINQGRAVADYVFANKLQPKVALPLTLTGRGEGEAPATAGGPAGVLNLLVDSVVKPLTKPAATPVISLASAVAAATASPVNRLATALPAPTVTPSRPTDKSTDQVFGSKALLDDVLCPN